MYWAVFYINNYKTRIPIVPEWRWFNPSVLKKWNYEFFTVVRARDPEEVFDILNNPKYERFHLALQPRAKLVGHTSMSAYDIVVNLQTFESYLCLPVDWLKVNFEDLPNDVKEKVVICRVLLEDLVPDIL